MIGFSRIFIEILFLIMAFALVGCGNEDFSQIDPAEFYGADEYAVPDVIGPTELPNVVGPNMPPPVE